MKRKCPWLVKSPIHPYTNVTWLIRISLHKALYIKIDQLCVTSPLSEKKPKARKSMLMSPCEMQQMICGGGRLKSFSLRGRGSFPHKSRHLPLLAGGMSLFHYLLALSCDSRALSFTGSAGLSASLALHLFPPFAMSFLPLFSLHHSDAVCQCLPLFGVERLK